MLFVMEHNIPKLALGRTNRLTVVRFAEPA